LLAIAERKGEGSIASNGAFAAFTGVHTGRSPKDKFIVVDDETRASVAWAEIDQAMQLEVFDRLAERFLRYARFHVDIGIGDEVLEPVEVVEGRDWLGFGGIAPPSFPIISREQQFAEKLHAYSLPREDRVNTRTKDLIDMLLLIRHEKLDNQRLAAAIKGTFAKRATHPVPQKLEQPPSEWEPVFQALARECDLDVRLSGGFEVVQDFVGKILGRQTG
jgi:hypothetical protein